MTQPTFDRPARPMVIRPAAPRTRRTMHPAIIVVWLFTTVALIALFGVVIANGYSIALDSITTPHMEGF